MDDYLYLRGILSGSAAYKGPEWVQIDLTNDCNNNCIGCWCNSPLLKERRMGAEAKGKSLPYQKVKEFIDEIRGMGTRRIVFSGGGEPLMHPEALEILRHAKARGMNCQLHTNFTLVDERVAMDLVNTGLDYLTVSLWAATGKTYAATHPNTTEETFYKIVEMLRFFSSIRKKKWAPHIRLHNVITNLNYREILWMAGLVKEVGAGSVSFAPIDAVSGYTDSLLLVDEERDELLDLCDSVKNNYSSALFDFDEFVRKISSDEASRGNYDKEVVDTTPCYAGWLFARLNADGSINSCLKSHRIPVGNIYEEKFGSIWNSVKQREFRKETLRLKKESPYFKSIGNEPSVAVGCWRGCDDRGMNIRMHRKMGLVSPVLKILGKSIYA